MRPAAIKREGAQHTVTIKPVTVLFTADGLPARAIAKECTLQIRWDFTLEIGQRVIVLRIQILQAAMTGWDPAGTFALYTHRLFLMKKLVKRHL